MMIETHHKTSLQNCLRIGIDIGGTFTDFVVYRPGTGTIETFKLLSTPDNPAVAVVQGLEKIRQRYPTGVDRLLVEVIHGSTVATNALLERKGARTAFIATAGFSDILEIGRQNRPALYDFFADPPPALVPAELRFEVLERVDHNGNVIQPLEESQLQQTLIDLQRHKPASVAVCLLFSYLHPEHEQQIAEHLREAGYFVSCSAEVLPEFREYERASTTAVNAYVTPVLDRYLSSLEGAVNAGADTINMRVMQSNGGNLSLAEARQYGVQCILSGPAGGIVGSQHIASLAQRQLPGELEQGRMRVITFDMGGTSTDVSLIDGQPKPTTEAVVGGCPIRIPMLDIHTIGAGGGSIAHLDPGGALRVGPHSAGADPGPACYGKGDFPTVTDANLILGRLLPDQFLGGQMELHLERAQDAITQLAKQIGISVVEAAAGIVEVVNAHMERALRVISVERGHDPRAFILLSFGGAGGLHAADLARRLGINRVLAPPLASTLSAYGMLAADVVKDFMQTVMLPGEVAFNKLSEVFAGLADRAQLAVSQSLSGGIQWVGEEITLEYLVDVRYVGQSYELTVPFTPEYISDFHAQHRQVYGYAQPGRPVEVVNVRLHAVQAVIPPYLEPRLLAGSDPGQAFLGTRPLTLQPREQPVEAPFYRGESLEPGNRLRGPAVVIRQDTTILLGARDQGEVDEYGNLWIEVGV